MNVEFINPFITAASDVFRTMLDCELARGPLALQCEHTPFYELSGLIGLSGRCRGMVVLSLGRQTAINAAEVLLGHRPDDVDGDVIDAIGELANMIAGAAKTRLEQEKLTIGLPTVICGKTQMIAFPSRVRPILIPFESKLGPICVQVGLAEA